MHLLAVDFSGADMGPSDPFGSGGFGPPASFFPAQQQPIQQQQKAPANEGWAAFNSDAFAAPPKPQATAQVIAVSA